MNLGRIKSLWIDVLRAVISVAVLGLVLTFLAGLGYTSRNLSKVSVIDGAVVEARPDTIAALLNVSAGTTRIDPAGSLLRTLEPLTLFTKNIHNGAESMEATLARLASRPSVMPTQGWLISNFSSRRLHPMLGYARPHLGIDVSAPRGTPIDAPARGLVISASWDGGYGRTVEIDHGWGIITRYAHTSKILVRVGDRVERGQMIALVGQTGLAEGPHLHYEVRLRGEPVDPLKFVLPAVFAD
jgi:murein DD-endopeptidase MepM/ murein hydrolase activator NlpD